MTLLIMPSVVSIPPNISTAAFETTSSVDRPVPLPAAAASATSETWLSAAAITARRLASSIRNACAPDALTPWSGGLGAAGGPGAPASADTAATIALYHSRTVAGSVWPSPSASATAPTASGPARPGRRSAAPRGRSAATSRPASAST